MPSISDSKPPGLSSQEVLKQPNNVATSVMKKVISAAMTSSPSSNNNQPLETAPTTAPQHEHNHIPHTGGSYNSGWGILGLVSFFADLIMIVGTAPGWIVQLRSVLQRGSAQGFSWQTALLLLSCYTLRVGYYFGEQYHIALLLQCFVMIVVVLSLIAAIIDAPDSATPLKKYQYGHVRSAFSTSSFPNVNETTQVTEDDFSSSPLNNHSTYIHDDAEEAHFATLHPNLASAWRKFDLLFKRRWAGGSYYFGFIAWGGPNTKFVYGVYSLILFSVCFFCHLRLPPSPFLTHAVGFIALGVEASVPLPQVIYNETRKSVDGLSKFLVATWFAGDLMKVLYFLAKSQPMPFIVSGLFQFGTDLFILGQFARFRNNSSGKQQQVDGVTLQNGKNGNTVIPSSIRKNVVTF